jgi:hypothetical protein
MITDYFHQFFQSDTWPFVGVIALVLPIIFYVPSLLSYTHPISAWKSLEIYSTKRKQTFISNAAGLLKAGLSKVRDILN